MVRISAWQSWSTRPLHCEIWEAGRHFAPVLVAVSICMNRSRREGQETYAIATQVNCSKGVFSPISQSPDQLGLSYALWMHRACSGYLSQWLSHSWESIPSIHRGGWWVCSGRAEHRNAHGPERLSGLLMDCWSGPLCFSCLEVEVQLKSSSFFVSIWLRDIPCLF